MRRRVDVVGGGIAGLAAAAVAARAGAQVELFESISQVGGRARTRDDGGFLFNMGPHALYEGGAGTPVLDELGVRVSGGVPPISGTLARHGGVLHALPGGFVSLLTTGLLRLPEKLEVGRYLARLPKMDTTPYDGRTLSEMLESELRSPVVRQLVRALVRLTSYTEAPDTMSAGAALSQAQLALDSSVRYLDGGWQSLVDAMLEAARGAGVTVRTGVRVRAVELEGGRVAGVRLSDGTRSDAGQVVLAMGPGEVSALCASGADPVLRGIAERSVPVRTACFDVGLRELPVPRQRFALGIDEPLYFSVHTGVARLAPEGAALIQIARYLAPDEKPDREALQTEFEGLLDQMQPGWRDRVVCQKLLADLRVTHAVVTAEAGGLPGRPGPRIDHLPGLFVAGDWVGPEGQLADAALASGRAAGLLAASNLGAAVAA